MPRSAESGPTRYIDGGDLLDVLNTQPRFREEEVRHIFRQIVCGVAFCHSLGVAHRDLKPENILIQRGVKDAPVIIKVADFGLSTLTQVGTVPPLIGVGVWGAGWWVWA
jgi:serine/threonine protein kinase